MIQDYLKAGYPVLMVRTHELERFIGSMVKKINGKNISYMQSQVPKVPRYPVRIQASLLFVVPRFTGATSNLHFIQQSQSVSVPPLSSD